MASLAARARPPIVMIVALAGLTLAMHPEPRHDHGPPRARPSLVVAVGEPVADMLGPPAFADAQAWPRGMVMGIPATGDPIAHDALTELLSGLFRTLASLRV